MVPIFATLPLAGANGRCRDMPNAASHVGALLQRPSSLSSGSSSISSGITKCQLTRPGRQRRADDVLKACSASASTRPGTAQPRLLLAEPCMRGKGPGQHLIEVRTTKLARPEFAKFSSGPRRPQTVCVHCMRSRFRRVSSDHFRLFGVDLVKQTPVRDLR